MCPCVLLSVLYVQLPYIRLDVSVSRSAYMLLLRLETRPTCLHQMKPYITLQCQSDFHDPVICGRFSDPKAEVMPLLVILVLHLFPALELNGSLIWRLIFQDQIRIKWVPVTFCAFTCVKYIYCANFTISLFILTFK